MFENKYIQGAAMQGVSPCYTNCWLTNARLSYQVAWERDLSIIPEVEDWRKWSMRIHKGILNVALIKASCKVHGRWYLDPERLYPDTSATCFRGCGQIGSPLHVWWSCPKVCHFWMRVHPFYFFSHNGQRHSRCEHRPTK